MTFAITPGGTFTEYFWISLFSLGSLAVYGFIFLFWLPRITGWLVTILVRWFLLDSNSSFRVKSVLFSPLKCRVFFKYLSYQNEDVSISIVEGGFALPILYSTPKYQRLHEDMLSENLLNMRCLVDSRLSRGVKGIITDVDIKAKKIGVRIDASVDGNSENIFPPDTSDFPHSLSRSSPILSNLQEKKKKWQLKFSSTSQLSDTEMSSRDFVALSSFPEDEDEGNEVGEVVNARERNREEEKARRHELSEKKKECISEEDPLMRMKSRTSEMLINTPQLISAPLKDEIHPEDRTSTLHKDSKRSEKMSRKNDSQFLSRKGELIDEEKEGEADKTMVLERHKKRKKEQRSGTLESNVETDENDDVDPFFFGGDNEKEMKKETKKRNTASDDADGDETGVFTFSSTHPPANSESKTGRGERRSTKNRNTKWYQYDYIFLPRTYSRCRCIMSGLQVSVYNSTGKYKDLVAAAAEVAEAEQYFKNADAQKRGEWCSSALNGKNNEVKEKLERPSPKFAERFVYYLMNRHRPAELPQGEKAKHQQEQQLANKTFSQRFFEFVKVVEIDVNNVSCSIGSASQTDFPFFLHLSSHRLSGSCYQTREGLCSPIDLHRSVFDFSLEKVGLRIAEMSAEAKELSKKVTTDEEELNDGCVLIPMAEGESERSRKREIKNVEGEKHTHFDRKVMDDRFSHRGKLPSDLFSVMIHPTDENAIHVRFYMDAPNVYAGEVVSAQLLPRTALEVSINLPKISFGPWAELVRKRLMQFFFPPNYVPLKPLNLKLGELRPRAPMDVVVTFIQNTTLELLFQRQSVTMFPPFGVATAPQIGALTVKVGASSEFIYRSGVLISGRENQQSRMLFSGKKIKAMVNAVLGSPCTLTELDSVQCYIDKYDSLLWNECKFWDITAVMSRGYVTYNTSYIRFFQDFLTDWQYAETTYAGEEFSIKTYNTTKRFIDEFVPEVRKINIIIENVVDIKFNINNQNVIYGRDAFDSTENALAVMRVSSANVELDLSSDQYLLRTLNQVSHSFHVTTQKVVVLLSLPPSHPCYDPQCEEAPFIEVDQFSIKAVFTVQITNQVKPMSLKHLSRGVIPLSNQLELAVTLSHARGDLSGTHMKAIYFFLDNYFIGHTTSISPCALFWLFPAIQRKEGFGENTMTEWLSFWTSAYLPKNFLEIQVTVQITDIEATVLPFFLLKSPCPPSSTPAWRNKGGTTSVPSSPSPSDQQWGRSPYFLLARCSEFSFSFAKTTIVSEITVIIKPITVRWILTEAINKTIDANTSSLKRRKVTGRSGVEKKKTHVLRDYKDGCAATTPFFFLHDRKPVHQPHEEQSAFLCLGEIVITMVNHYGPLPRRVIVQRKLHVDAGSIRFDISAAHLYHLVCTCKALEYEALHCEDRFLEEAIVLARQDAETFVMLHKMEMDSDEGRDEDSKHFTSSFESHSFSFSSKELENNRHAKEYQRRKKKKNDNLIPWEREDWQNKKEEHREARERGEEIASLSDSLLFSHLKTWRGKGKGNHKQYRNFSPSLQNQIKEEEISAVEKIRKKGELKKESKKKGKSRTEQEDESKSEREGRQTRDVEHASSFSIFSPRSPLYHHNSESALPVFSSKGKHSLCGEAEESQKYADAKKRKYKRWTRSSLRGGSLSSSSRDNSDNIGGGDGRNLAPNSAAFLRSEEEPPWNSSSLVAAIPMVSPWFLCDDPFSVPPFLAKKFADFLSEAAQEQNNFDTYGLTFLHASVNDVSGVVRLKDQEAVSGNEKTSRRGSKGNNAQRTSPSSMEPEFSSSRSLLFSSSDLFWLYLPHGIRVKICSLQTLASRNQITLELPCVQLHGMRSATVVCPFSALFDQHRNGSSSSSPLLSASPSFASPQKLDERQFRRGGGRVAAYGSPVGQYDHLMSEIPLGDASSLYSRETYPPVPLSTSSRLPYLIHSTGSATSGVLQGDLHDGYSAPYSAAGLSPPTKHGMDGSARGTPPPFSGKQSSLSLSAFSSSYLSFSSSSLTSSSLEGSTLSPPKNGTLPSTRGIRRHSSSTIPFSLNRMKKSHNNNYHDNEGEPHRISHHPRFSNGVTEKHSHYHSFNAGNNNRGDSKRGNNGDGYTSFTGVVTGGQEEEEENDEGQKIDRIRERDERQRRHSIRVHSSSRVTKEILVRLFFLHTGCTVVHHTKVSERDGHDGEHVQKQREWFRQNNALNILYECFLTERNGLWREFDAPMREGRKKHMNDVTSSIFGESSSFVSNKDHGAFSQRESVNHEIERGEPSELISTTKKDAEVVSRSTFLPGVLHSADRISSDVQHTLMGAVGEGNSMRSTKKAELENHPSLNASTPTNYLSSVDTGGNEIRSEWEKKLKGVLKKPSSRDFPARSPPPPLSTSLGTQLNNSSLSMQKAEMTISAPPKNTREEPSNQNTVSLPSVEIVPMDSNIEKSFHPLHTKTSESGDADTSDLHHASSIQRNVAAFEKNILSLLPKHSSPVASSFASSFATTSSISSSSSSPFQPPPASPTTNTTFSPPIASSPPVSTLASSSPVVKFSLPFLSPVRNAGPGQQENLVKKTISEPSRNVDILNLAENDANSSPTNTIFPSSSVSDISSPHSPRSKTEASNTNDAISSHRFFSCQSCSSLSTDMESEGCVHSTTLSALHTNDAAKDAPYDRQVEEVSTPPAPETFFTRSYRTGHREPLDHHGRKERHIRREDMKKKGKRPLDTSQDSCSFSSDIQESAATDAPLILTSSAASKRLYNSPSPREDLLTDVTTKSSAEVLSTSASSEMRASYTELSYSSSMTSPFSDEEWGTKGEEHVDPDHFYAWKSTSPSGGRKAKNETRDPHFTGPSFATQSLQHEDREFTPRRKERGGNEAVQENLHMQQEDGGGWGKSHIPYAASSAGKKPESEAWRFYSYFRQVPFCSTTIYNQRYSTTATIGKSNSGIAHMNSNNTNERSTSGDLFGGEAFTTTFSPHRRARLTALSYNPHRLASDGNTDRTAFSAPLPNIFFSCVCPSTSSEEPYLRSHKDSLPSLLSFGGEVPNAYKTAQNEEDWRKEKGKSELRNRASETEREMGSRAVPALSRDSADVQSFPHMQHSGANHKGGSRGVQEQEIRSFPYNWSEGCNEKGESLLYENRNSTKADFNSEVNGGHSRCNSGGNRLDLLTFPWKPSDTSSPGQSITREHIFFEFNPNSSVLLSSEICTLVGPIISFLRSCGEMVTNSSPLRRRMLKPGEELGINAAGKSSLIHSSTRGRRESYNVVKYSFPSTMSPNGYHVAQGSYGRKSVSPMITTGSDALSSQKFNFDAHHSCGRLRKKSNSLLVANRSSSQTSTGVSSISTNRRYSSAPPHRKFSEIKRIAEDQTAAEKYMVHNRFSTPPEKKKTSHVFYKARKPLKMFIMHGRIPKLQIDIFGRAILKGNPPNLHEGINKMIIHGLAGKDRNCYQDDEGKRRSRSPSSFKSDSLPSGTTSASHMLKGRLKKDGKKEAASHVHSQPVSPNTLSSPYHAGLRYPGEESIVRLSAEIYDLNLLFQKKPKPRRQNRHALQIQKQISEAAAAEAGFSSVPPNSQTFSLILRHSDAVVVCSVSENCRWKNPLAVDIPHFVRAASLSRGVEGSGRKEDASRHKLFNGRSSLTPSSGTSRCVVGVVYAGTGRSVVCANAVPLHVAISPISLETFKGHFTCDVGYVAAMLGACVEAIGELRGEIALQEAEDVSPFVSTTGIGFSSLEKNTLLLDKMQSPSKREKKKCVSNEVDRIENTLWGDRPVVPLLSVGGMAEAKAPPPTAIYFGNSGASSLGEQKQDSFSSTSFSTFCDGLSEESNDNEKFLDDYSSASFESKNGTVLPLQSAKFKKIQVEGKLSLQSIFLELYHVLPEKERHEERRNKVHEKGRRNHRKNHTVHTWFKEWNAHHFVGPYPLASYRENHLPFPSESRHSVQRWVIGSETNSCSVGPCFVHLSGKWEKPSGVGKLSLNAASHISSIDIQMYPNLLVNTVQVLQPLVEFNPTPNGLSEWENANEDNTNAAGGAFSRWLGENPALALGSSNVPSHLEKKEVLHSSEEIKGVTGSKSAKMVPFFAHYSTPNEVMEPKSTSAPLEYEKEKIGLASGLFPNLLRDSMEINLCCRLGRLETSVRHSKDNLFRFSVQDIVACHSTPNQASLSDKVPDPKMKVDLNRLSLFIKTRLWYLGVKAKLKFLQQSAVAPCMLSVRPKFQSTSSFMLRSMTLSYHPDISIDTEDLQRSTVYLLSPMKKGLEKMKIAFHEVSIVVHHCAVSTVRSRQKHASLQLSGINVDLPHILHFMEIVYPQLQHLIFSWRYSLSLTLEYHKKHVLATQTLPTSSPHASLSSSQVETKVRRPLSSSPSCPPSSERKRKITTVSTPLERGNISLGNKSKMEVDTEFSSLRKPTLCYPWNEIPSLVDHQEFRAAGTSYSFWVLMCVRDIKVSLGLDMNVTQEYRLPKLLCFGEYSDHRWKLKTQIDSSVVSSSQSQLLSSLSGFSKNEENESNEVNGQRRGQKFGRKRLHRDSDSTIVKLPRIFIEFSGDEKKLRCTGVVESIKANITAVVLQHGQLAIRRIQKDIFPLLRPIPIPHSKDNPSSFLSKNGSMHSRNSEGGRDGGSSCRSSHEKENPYKLVALQKVLYRKRDFSALFCGVRVSCGANAAVLRCSLNCLTLFGDEVPQSDQRKMKWLLNLDKGEIALTDRVKPVGYEERRSQKRKQKAYSRSETLGLNEYEKQNEWRAIDPSVLNRVNHPSSFDEQLNRRTYSGTAVASDGRDGAPSSDRTFSSVPKGNIYLSSFSKQNRSSSVESFKTSREDDNIKKKQNDLQGTRYRNESQRREKEDEVPKAVYRSREKIFVPRAMMITDHTEVNGFVWGSFAFSGKLRSDEHVKYKVTELPANHDLRVSLLNRFQESTIRCEANLLSPVCIIRVGAPAIAGEFIQEIKETIKNLSKMSMKERAKSLASVQYERKFKKLKETKNIILRYIEQTEMEQRREFDLQEKEIMKELLLKEGIDDAKVVFIQRIFNVTVNHAGLIVPFGGAAYNYVLEYPPRTSSKASPSFFTSSLHKHSHDALQAKEFVPHFAFKALVDQFVVELSIKKRIRHVLAESDNNVFNTQPLEKAIGCIRLQSLKAFFTDGSPLLVAPPSVYAYALLKSTIFGGKGILSLSDRSEEFEESRNTLIVPSVVMPFHLEKSATEKVSKWRTVADIASPEIRCSPWIYVIFSEIKNELGFALPRIEKKVRANKIKSALFSSQKSSFLNQNLKKNSTSRLNIPSLFLNGTKMNKDLMGGIRGSRSLSLSHSSFFSSGKVRKELNKDLNGGDESTQNTFLSTTSKGRSCYGSRGVKSTRTKNRNAAALLKYQNAKINAVKDDESDKVDSSEETNEYDEIVKESLFIDVSARLDMGKIFIFSHTCAEEASDVSSLDGKFRSSRNNKAQGSSVGKNLSSKISSCDEGMEKVNNAFPSVPFSAFRASLGYGGEKTENPDSSKGVHSFDRSSDGGIEAELHYCMDYEGEKMKPLSFFYLPSAVVHGCFRRGENKVRETVGGKMLSDSDEDEKKNSFRLGEHCIVRAEVDLKEVRLFPSLFMITDEIALVTKIYDKLRIRRPEEVIRRIKALSRGTASKIFFEFLHSSPVELFLPVPHRDTSALLAQMQKEEPQVIKYIHSNAFLSNSDTDSSHSSFSSSSRDHGGRRRKKGLKKKKSAFPLLTDFEAHKKQNLTINSSKNDLQSKTTSIHVSMRHFNLILDTSPIHSTTFSCFLGETGSIDFLLQLYGASEEGQMTNRRTLQTSGLNRPASNITLHVNQLRAECQTKLEVKSLEVYVPEITVAVSLSTSESRSNAQDGKIHTQTISLNIPFKGEFSEHNALLRLQHFSQVFLVYEIWYPTLKLYSRAVQQVSLPARSLSTLKKNEGFIEKSFLKQEEASRNEISLSESSFQKKSNLSFLQNSRKKTRTYGRKEHNENYQEMEREKGKEKNAEKTKKFQKENLFIVAFVSSGWFEVDMGGGNLQHLNSGALKIGFQRSITPNKRTLYRAKLRFNDAFVKSDGILSGSLRISNVMALMYKVNNLLNSAKKPQNDEVRPFRFHIEVDGLLCAYKERYIKEVLNWKAESFVLNGMNEVNHINGNSLFYLNTEVSRSKLRLTPSTVPGLLNFLYSFNVIIRNCRTTTTKKIQSALQGKNLPSHICKTFLLSQQQMQQEEHTPPAVPNLKAKKGEMTTEERNVKELDKNHENYVPKDGVLTLETGALSSSSPSASPFLSENEDKRKKKLYTAALSDRLLLTSKREEEKYSEESKSSTSKASAPPDTSFSSEVDKSSSCIPFLGGEYTKIPSGQLRLCITNTAITFGDVDNPGSVNMVVVQVPHALVCFAECTSENDEAAKRFLRIDTRDLELFRPQQKKSLILGLKRRNILEFYTCQKLGSREVGYTLDLSQEQPWTGNPLYRDFSEVIELVNQFINNSNVQIFKKLMTGSLDEAVSRDEKPEFFLTSSTSLIASPTEGGGSMHLPHTGKLLSSLQVQNTSKEVNNGGSKTLSSSSLPEKIAKKAELHRIKDPRIFRALRSINFSPQVRFGGDVSVNTEVILNWFGVTEKVLPRAIHCSICDKLEKALDKGAQVISQKKLKF